MLTNSGTISWNYGENYLDNRAICLHSFADLSHVSPVTFVCLLKECYIYGTLKATSKFRLLQNQVLQALFHAPQPGPCTFVVQSLYVLPLFGPSYAEGFSHLLMSALNRLCKLPKKCPDSTEAKKLAALLFLDLISGLVDHEVRIVVKLLKMFQVGLKDIANSLCELEVNGDSLNIAKARVEQYVFGFIESGDYPTAVILLEHFSMRELDESFLERIIQDDRLQTAEKWATFMGKPMINSLIQKYLSLNMVKDAYTIIKKHNLKKEFPDAVRLHKESSIKKLAQKGCWDVAEMKIEDDRQLIEYLVFLAMEAGYTEKVDELCERYSLKGFVKSPESTSCSLHSRFLHITDLAMEDIIWVDESDGLLSATSYIEGCKVVGIDCEWKPNYEKGSKPKKVSIMQIATGQRVFILDLITLYETSPSAMENCLKRIIHSPSILKIGYNFRCDILQLSRSYENLESLRHYMMFLDIEKLFKGSKGGLSGLVQEIFGVGLNKTRRNSDWEQRPLSKYQIEYAALDAAVLVNIFHHVQKNSHSLTSDELVPAEWKSHLVSNVENTKPSKKKH